MNSKMTKQHPFPSSFIFHVGLTLFLGMNAGMNPGFCGIVSGIHEVHYEQNELSYDTSPFEGSLNEPTSIEIQNMGGEIEILLSRDDHFSVIASAEGFVDAPPPLVIKVSDEISLHIKAVYPLQTSSPKTPRVRSLTPRSRASSGDLETIREKRRSSNPAAPRKSNSDRTVKHEQLIETVNPKINLTIRIPATWVTLIKAESFHGNITLKNVLEQPEAQSQPSDALAEVALKTKNGSIQIKSVVVTEKISAESYLGDVNITDCSGAISAKSYEGSIYGLRNSRGNFTADCPRGFCDIFEQGGEIVIFPRSECGALCDSPSAVGRRLEAYRKPDGESPALPF